MLAPAVTAVLSIRSEITRQVAAAGEQDLAGLSGKSAARIDLGDANNDIAVHYTVARSSTISLLMDDSR